MSRFRVFLLWLVMLALPVQGYAAASMALCGTPQRADAVAAAVHPTTSAMHDHASHDHAAMHADHDGGADAAHAKADTPHKCSTCGGACHAVALTSSQATASFDPVPEAELAEPAAAMATLPPRLPDKPPRA